MEIKTSQKKKKKSFYDQHFSCSCKQESYLKNLRLVVKLKSSIFKINCCKIVIVQIIELISFLKLIL